jgi:hypothetical protein
MLVSALALLGIVILLSLFLTAAVSPIKGDFVAVWLRAFLISIGMVALYYVLVGLMVLAFP